MDVPILATKLNIPAPRSTQVLRPRLVERLERGLALGRRLTLVSAPAGYGKTTLVANWLATSKRPVAWLSLDEGDNDAVQFLRYLIAALQRVRPRVGAEVLEMLSAAPLQSARHLVAPLINEIAAAGDHEILVLDDYQLVDLPAVHEIVTVLLQRIPAGMHVVILTRQDPPLPLPQFRARDQVTEIRERDLRFTAAEAAAFLNESMELSLTADAVAKLEARTEGWISGLQLAALALNENRDAERSEAFIAAFTGSNRLVLDYLAEEVLERQPTELHEFLLQTSILARLTGTLCNAVTGHSNGQAMLERLERTNLFIIPLDQDRIWYQYHRLFAEFLRHRLGETASSEAIATLHRNASAWYERNSLVGEAVGHALQAGDFERAAELILKEVLADRMLVQPRRLRSWIEVLPEAVVRAHPRVCLAHAWVLLLTGEPDAAENRVRDALDAAREGDTEIMGEAAAVSLMSAVLQNDQDGVLRWANAALTYLPEGRLFLRATMALNLGFASDMKGETEAALHAYGEAASLGQAVGDAVIAVMSTVQLGDIQALRGELHRAAGLYTNAIHLGTRAGGQVPVTASAYLGLGRLLYEWDDLEGAARRLESCIELGRRWENADLLAAGYAQLALVQQTRGNVDGAREAKRRFDEAIESRILMPSTITVGHAYEARLWVRQGNLEAAAAWARRYGTPSARVAGLQPGLEEATWARILLAQGHAEPVNSVLDSLIPLVEAAGHLRNVVELLTLRALARDALGASASALQLLEQALVLAQREGYVRTFADEGPAMARLLRAVLAMERESPRAVSNAYVQLLIDASEPDVAHEGIPLENPALLSRQPGTSRRVPLIEPLSERELEVLQLIATGLSNAEIAHKLMITTGTVKRHINNIFGKLDVHSRTQAVARARTFGLPGLE